MGGLIALLAILGAGSGVISLIIRNLYYICQPNEVLIFAGSERRLGQKKVGYRLVKGGSSLRTPLLEKAMRMDLTNMIIELRVSNAYSKGGIPLKVDGVANIKIAGEEPTIHNAIERLLGKSRKEIEKIAKETLEGNLRGVLASLTPEQVNEDKIAFAKSLLDEAEEDLEKLGLVLDTLQIQNISDEVRYLDSIGRKQQAELQRDARIAEAEAKAASAVQTAENEKITAVRRIDRDMGIAEAEAERRIQDALTQRPAVVAEAEAEIAAELARIQAEIPVQQERIKQVAQQLKADVIAPAEADCKRAIAQAKGDAARILEDGKAQAEGTQKLAESWQTAGASARDIFLLQKLETLLKTMTATVPDVAVQNVTVIDGQTGGMAKQAVSFIEQLRQTTGLDIAAAVNGLTARSDGDSDVKGAIAPQPVVPQPAQPDAFSARTIPYADTRHREESAAEESAAIETVDSTRPVFKEAVKKMLDRVAQTNPTQADAEARVERTVKTLTSLKQHLRQAWEADGDAALADLLEHPQLKIPVSKVKTWIL
ncbi:MAG: flotillin family protein [Leptolyngbya sp. SIO4C1]|nr:flotillin family protein [Leptolyngbya sp. SIO4C1]